MAWIRPMREEDVDDVRRVDAAAFGGFWSRYMEKPADLPLRTRINVLSNMAKDPDGCFVAEEEGRVVGYIFSRTWGTMTWFGPFGVLPQMQGRDIGKQLIAASVGYLRRPGRSVGLETMPESAANLGLYLRQEFEPRFLTFTMVKELDNTAGQNQALPRWSSTDAGRRERWLGDLRRAMDRIQAGLDSTKEIAITEQFSLGDTLLLTDGLKAVGCATLSLAGVREGAGSSGASIQTMALDPACTNEDTFRALLDASEALARENGKSTLAAPINGAHTWALNRLLAWGYRVDRALVRMILAGTDAGPTVDQFVELARWAG